MVWVGLMRKEEPMPQEAAPTAKSPDAPQETSAAPPWPPLVLGLASLIFTAGFSSLWGGVMASLNRRRLDQPKIPLWPIIIGVLALGASIATSISSGTPWWMTPYSRIRWLFLLQWGDFWQWWIGPAMEVLGCLVILLFGFLPQRQRYREWRAANGRRSSIAIPVLAGMSIAVCSLALDGLSQGRYFEEMANTAYKAGLEQFAAGHLDQAKEEFDQAIRFNPDHAKALMLRAKIYLANGKNKEALEDLAHAIKKRPDDMGLRLDRAAVAMETGDAPQAIEDANLVLKEHPDLAPALDLRAKAYAWQKKFPEAIADLNRIIRLNPEHTNALIRRAELQLASGKKKEALEDLAHAIEKRPDDVELRLERAAVALGAGEAGQTIEDANLILKQRPDYAPALYTRATAYEQQKKLDKALADLDAAVKVEPKSDFFRSKRALLRLQLGMMDQAIEDFTKLIEKQPKSPKYHFYRAEAYLQKKEMQKAEDDYSKAIKLQPNNFLYYFAQRGCIRGTRNCKKPWTITAKRSKWPTLGRICTGHGPTLT